MRKFILIIFVALLTLSFALPASSAPPDKDAVKLRVFVHYPKPGKPAPQPGTCNAGEGLSKEFGLAGWKLSGTVVYRVNYNTIPGTVANPKIAIAKSFNTWQQQVTTKGISLGEGAPTSARVAKYDGQNVVVWGAVPAGAIAMAYIWYYSSTGQVVETDIVMGKNLPWAYTQVDDPDQSCGPLYAYDVQDILTHEVGHWMGLDDLYTYTEQDLTMYGYGDKGELKKDTLGAGDELGISARYY